ncbi:MAG: hypothetical protein LBG06_12255 [Deltaproteobacteria bacterium]|jgi:hypothetical protein|nr:hypothetical protein [Deltaproteobacteria bacterium]
MERLLASGAAVEKAGKGASGHAVTLWSLPRVNAVRPAWPDYFLSWLQGLEEYPGIERRPDGIWCDFARMYIMLPSPAMTALLGIPPSVLLEDAVPDPAPEHVTDSSS